MLEGTAITFEWGINAGLGNGADEIRSKDWAFLYAHSRCSMSQSVGNTPSTQGSPPSPRTQISRRQCRSAGSEQAASGGESPSVLTDHLRLVAVTVTWGEPCFGRRPRGRRKPVVENAGDRTAEPDTRGLKSAHHRPETT